jgi:hypothetical protein
MTPEQKKRIAAAVPAFISLLSALFSLQAAGTGPCPGPIPAEPKYLEALKNIYREVKDLGAYPGQDFISREFFLGPADDDTYKDEHIAVLIQKLEGREKMRIQVTEMEIVNDKPRIQAAKATKSVVCWVGRDFLTIERSEFSEDKLSRLAPEILRAIQAKKKLLKLTDRPPSDF